MTSNEFVAFLKGMTIGMEGTPTDEQWVVIVKNLTKVTDEEEKETNILIDIKKEVDKGLEKIKKNFPGSPPDIWA